MIRVHSTSFLLLGNMSWIKSMFLMSGGLPWSRSNSNSFLLVQPQAALTLKQVQNKCSQSRTGFSLLHAGFGQRLSSALFYCKSCFVTIDAVDQGEKQISLLYLQYFILESCIHKFFEVDLEKLQFNFWGDKQITHSGGVNCFG